MSIKISNLRETIYVHDTDDTHSIVWFNFNDRYSLSLGETTGINGIDLLGVDEI